MDQYFSVSGAMVFAALFLSWMVRSRWARRVMDRPNERSLHAIPVPRSGGLALVGGVSLGWFILAPPEIWNILVPFLLLALVSYVDDWRGMPVPVRLLAHIAAAVGCVAALAYASFSAVGLALVVLALVWATNLFNFMDGADGLAGGMSLFGFVFLGAQAFVGGDTTFALMNWVVASVALVFLWFNFHPARIFMGDVGSIPLGFLGAALGLAGHLKGLWPAWFPILVFSPFIVDATLTLFKRALRGEKIWQAHREHYYQRLILLGHGHRKVAWLEYGLMFAAGISALWGSRQPAVVQVILLGAWIIIYIVLARMIDKSWREAGNKIK